MNHYEYWCRTHTSPFHFPVTREVWDQSMNQDTDSQGRRLFDSLETVAIPGGLIQYGITAIGFDENGEITDQVHYPVIRDLCFDSPEVGQNLLNRALADFGETGRIYAFFHYFGMSCCARHGKLHESQDRIHDLLLKNGFVVEHENVYFSKVLDMAGPEEGVVVLWKAETPGHCREFAASVNDREVCWGEVHFLPQGDVAYLRWIFTDSSKQHQGIGKKVMLALFTELFHMGIRRFDTDTALDNTVAQNYYKKCGFSNEGITRSYYTK